jgi:hypothetical protein
VSTDAAGVRPERPRARSSIAAIAAIVAVAVAIRLAAFFLFPFVITEDSNAYLLAAEFIQTGNRALLNYLAYRQLGYPGLILLLDTISSTPVLWLILLQIALGSASCGLIALIALRTGVSRPIALGLAAWYALYSRAIIYSTVVAPETLLVFLALLAAWLILRMTEAMLSASDAATLRLGGLLGLVLGAAAAIRETFLIMAALAIGTVAVVMIRRARRGAAVAAVALVLLTAAAIEAGALVTSRTLLGSSRLRPYAFPWAISLDCYYLDAASPPYPGLSARLAPQAAANRAQLASWDYQLGENAGYRKGNLCVENGFLATAQAYIRDELRIMDPYLAYVKLQDVLAAAAVDAVPRNVGHYLRWWLLPEVLRGILPLESPREFDSFRHFTMRELEPGGQLPALAAEVATTAPYALARRERSVLQWGAAQVLTALTFHRFWIFSVLFAAGGWIVVVRALRSEPAPQAAVYAFLWLYAWATIVQTAAIVWFFERYTMYVTFAYVLVAGKLADQAWKRCTRRQP